MKKLSLLLFAAFLIGCGGGGGSGDGGTGGAGTVSAPTFSPTPGAYTSAQSVTLSTSTPEASIRYTTDGSTPSETVGTVYAGPIAVASSMTIRAVAYLSGWTTSSVSIGAYTIGGFSQADVTGTWDVISILSGANAGWFHATETFDGSGNAISITNFLDSTGSTDPGSIDIRWTIDSTGVVSQFENDVLIYLGTMSSDRKLIFWVGTQDDLTHTVQMTIARKRTGTAFTNADLENIPFSYHALATGADINWAYGTGNFNGLRQITLTSLEVPPGYLGILPPPNFDTGSVSPEGIVTLAGDTSFYGLMTDDKKVTFIIREDGDINWLFVFMETGQTFSQADHEGIYAWASLRNSAPDPGWGYGVVDIDATGNGSYLSYTDSSGGLPTPSTFTRDLSATGAITDPADATYHGQMSYNKDVTVRTNTTGTSNYGLAISVR